MQWAILGAAFLVGVFARQEGPEMCTLYPGRYEDEERGFWHGTKQRSSSYKLTITHPRNANCYDPNKSYSLKLEGRTARDNFHGFLCQARKYQKTIDEVVDVGSFDRLPKNSVKHVEYLNCMAHTHERSKRRVTAVWLAPASTEAGKIELVCTVVKVERGPVYGYVWNRKRDSVKVWERKPTLVLPSCSSSDASRSSPSPRSRSRSRSRPRPRPRPRSRSSSGSGSCSGQRDQRTARDCSTWKSRGFCGRRSVKRLCAQTCCDSTETSSSDSSACASLSDRRGDSCRSFQRFCKRNANIRNRDCRKSCCLRRHRRN